MAEGTALEMMITRIIMEKMTTVKINAGAHVRLREPVQGG